MKKALFFTAFNRVGYLKETLASWAKVENFDGWHIGFYIEPSDVIDQIGQVIKSFLDDINFDSYSIHYNQELLGNATNTWQGFEDLFNDYDFVVLAEDDVIVSKDVLRYFDQNGTRVARGSSFQAMPYERSNTVQNIRTWLARVLSACQNACKPLSYSKYKRPSSLEFAEYRGTYL